MSLALLLAVTTFLAQGCVIRIGQAPQPAPTAPAPVPTVPAPVPTVPAPMPPAPTAIPAPVPVPPTLPDCYVQITRANTAEICGFIACPAGYVTTMVVKVQLESGLPGANGAAQTIGEPVAASGSSANLGVPAVPPGSEQRAFRFDLAAAPFAGNPLVGSGQPVVVAIPATAPGGNRVRSRVVFLREIRRLEPHIVQITTDRLRGFVGIPVSVTATSIDLQLLAIAEPGDPATSAFVNIGPSRTVSATGVDTPAPEWALGPLASGSPATPGQMPPFPYPYPPPPTQAPVPVPFGPGGPGARMIPVWVECPVETNPAIDIYLQQGRRLVLMASAPGFPRAFSRPAQVTQALGTGYGMPFRMLGSGRNCQAPTPGVQIARDRSGLDTLIGIIGQKEVGPLAAPNLDTESVIGICLPVTHPSIEVAVSSVRVTGSAVEVSLAYRAGMTPPANAGVRPWLLFAVPAVKAALPVRIIDEPIQYPPGEQPAAQAARLNL